MLANAHQHAREIDMEKDMEYTPVLPLPMKRPMCDVLASIRLAGAAKAVSAPIDTGLALPRLFVSTTSGFSSARLNPF